MHGASRVAATIGDGARRTGENRAMPDRRSPRRACLARMWSGCAALRALAAGSAIPAIAAAAVSARAARAAGEPRAPARARPPYTVADRVAQYGPEAETHLRELLDDVSIDWPPREVALLAFKDSRTLEMHARDDPADRWRYVTSWPVIGASGGPGPKLREGDEQVPEGVYRIESLNPNSRYHLALRLDYPNAFDREMAAADRRAALGGDIMIHGEDYSVGCLAMGNDTARELFVLAARTGLERIRVVIAPTDLREQRAELPEGAPRWVSRLYRRLAHVLSRYGGDW